MEVLSVVAAQIKTIQNGLEGKKKTVEMLGGAAQSSSQRLVCGGGVVHKPPIPILTKVHNGEMACFCRETGA